MSCDNTYKQIVYNGITTLNSNIFDISNVGIITYKGDYNRLINISATFTFLSATNKFNRII